MPGGLSGNNRESRGMNESPSQAHGRDSMNGLRLSISSVFSGVACALVNRTDSHSLRKKEGPHMSIWNLGVQIVIEATVVGGTIIVNWLNSNRTAKYAKMGLEWGCSHHSGGLEPNVWPVIVGQDHDHCQHGRQCISRAGSRREDRIERVSGTKVRLTDRTKRIWAGAWRKSAPRMMTRHDL